MFQNQHTILNFSVCLEVREYKISSKVAKVAALYLVYVPAGSREIEAESKQFL